MPKKELAFASSLIHCGINAFLEKGSGIGNTFYKLGPTLHIDVCFADTSLQVLQCIREEKDLSDHYPVITDI